MHSCEACGQPATTVIRIGFENFYLCNIHTTKK